MKKIKMELTTASVRNALYEVQKYRDDLKRRTELLRQRIGEVIRWTAEDGFASAIVDDTFMTVSGGVKTPVEPRHAQVDVSIHDEGDTTVILANGEDAVWVEFGAGVHHNGSVGSSPHPNGAGLGFTIGSYGTNGRKEVWGFYEGGQLVLTHGTPASMPMYRGVREACDHIAEIAREVFQS